MGGGEIEGMTCVVVGLLKKSQTFEIFCRCGFHCDWFGYLWDSCDVSRLTLQGVVTIAHVHPRYFMAPHIVSQVRDHILPSHPLSLQVRCIWKHETPSVRWPKSLQLLTLSTSFPLMSTSGFSPSLKKETERTVENIFMVAGVFLFCTSITYKVTVVQWSLGTHSRYHNFPSHNGSIFVGR